MVEELVIIGAGSHAREILDTIDASNRTGSSNYNVLGFLVEASFGLPGTLVQDKPILGDFSWLARKKEAIAVICAVGDPVLRKRLVLEISRYNVFFPNIIHPSVIVTAPLTLGEGNVIMAGSILTNQISIGNHTNINLACTISHDTVLMDFATLSPGVHLTGKVNLETGCFIGAGATIIPNTKVGEWSIVGAGSVIITDVPPNTTVVGNPGKVIKVRNVNG